jgi:predicted AAA+ superfamily ATPase
MKYFKRKLEKLLKKYLLAFPVIGIIGPRQSGKSTMLLNTLKDSYTYVTFDDFRIINFFYEDPEKFMETYNDKIIFDEVQKVPEIFSYIKIAVDRDRQNYGKFILTSSSQFIF